MRTPHSRLEERYLLIVEYDNDVLEVLTVACDDTRIVQPRSTE